jgi:hypothetical protein
MACRWVIWNPVPLTRSAYGLPGFMRHPPNLLKQESSSAATLVNVLLRLSSDKRPSNAGTRLQASDRLIQ